MKVLQTFFVNGFDCRAWCDPEESNPIGLRVPVKAEAFAAATTAVDVTDSRQERPVVKSAPKKRETWQLDESSGLSLEDAGFKTQPPASTWIASIAPTLTATDGQTLGTRGSSRSRTGISARSPALATATASGRPAVDHSCRSTRGIS